MRIVSMLSSATEIVYALGLQDRLVAISHECDYPPEALALPRASRSRFDPSGMTSAEVDAAVRRSMREHGSVYEVDREALRALRPDLVLTQAICEVCAVPTGSVLDAVAGLPTPPEVVSLDAHSLEDVIDSVRRVADAAGVPERGREVASELRGRLERVREAVAGRARPRVLLLEWLDPPFAPGHWVPEMVEAAGGEGVIGVPRARSHEIEWSGIPRDPDVLLIEPCGWDLAGARADADRHRDGLREIAARAIDAGRAWLLHSSYYSRSGPRLVDGVEALAAILHPGAVPAPPHPAIAERWS